MNKAGRLGIYFSGIPNPNNTLLHIQIPADEVFIVHNDGIFKIQGQIIVSLPSIISTEPCIKAWPFQNSRSFKVAFSSQGSGAEILPTNKEMII